MTQIHPDTRPDGAGEGGQHPQQDPAGQAPPPHDPFARPTGEQPAQADHTAPVWYGQTQEIPRGDLGTEQPDTGRRAQPATARPAGDTFATPPFAAQAPAGPLPSSVTRDGAEAAQPARRRRWTELTAVAALAAVLASGGTYAAAQLDDGPQTSSTASTSTLGRGTDTGPVVQADPANPNWTATAAAVSPSVVAITVASGQGEGQGSGVVIDDKGHIITNNHVVAGGGSNAQITVTLNDGRTYKATIAGTDPSTDLAVITIADPPSDLKPIALGDSEQLNVGDAVMAVGNPLGLAGTVTTGIVSALNRPVTTEAQDDSQPQSPFGQGAPGQQGGTDSETVVTNAIQTSAAINPGNSGGALVNASGQLVGINSSIATLGSSSGSSGSIGIGFAIPVNEAKLIASQLIEDGTADHAFLGVTSQDGSASDGSSQRAGAQIASVSPGTPAAEAGLQEGDVVVKVDDDAVSSSEALVASIRERAVGDTVELTVLREGRSVTLTATLTAKATTRR
jgi:putative serine protease PepD